MHSFALPVLYLKRLINFILQYIIVNNLDYFSSLNIRSELEVEL